MQIQILEESDIAKISALQPKDWRDIMPTIRWYTQSDFCLPLKFSIEEEIVGMGTAIFHNDVAWLAHIIVQPEYRNQGIGSLITQTLIERVYPEKCQSLFLIATPFGEPVYKKNRFTVETDYVFYEGKPIGKDQIGTEFIQPYSEAFLPQIAHLDRKATGENRMFHLQNSLPTGHYYIRDGKLEGFYLPTFNEGPIIASTKTAGTTLLKWSLQSNEFAIIPSDNLTAAEVLGSCGFREIKREKRMHFGKKRAWEPSYIYGRTGGNLG